MVLVVITACAVILGCGGQPTGVHVHARMPGVAYDELRFSVVLVPPAESSQPAQTIVDPATQGRYLGPFGNGDQDVFIYLKEEIGDQMVSCAAVALMQDALAASGAVQVVIEPQRIVDTDVFLLPPAMSP